MADPPGYWRERKAFFAFLAKAAAIVLAYAVVAEAVLRFLPVTTGLRAVAVDAAQPIFHYEPDRDFVYSRGWALRDPVHGRVNNAGWVNDQDYVRDGGLPTIAVIGDSFIEAQMVPYAETLQGRLAAALDGKARVYSFAAAGAPLGEFAVFAGHAVRAFGASAVVVNMVDFDFAMSDIAYAQPQGMWVYDDGGTRLRLLPYHPSWLRLLARRSALVRYLMLNGEIEQRLGAAWRAAPALAPVSRANAAGPVEDPARLATSTAVLSSFFRDFARLVPLPPDHVLFVLDGVRYRDQLAAADLYLRRMRAQFHDAAKERGYGTVDLEPLFFARPGEEFEFPGDVHWNAEGHAVATSGVLSSPLIRELLTQPR